MEIGNKTYKPPPCSVFLVGSHRNQAGQTKTPRRCNSLFFTKVQNLEQKSELFHNSGKSQVEEQENSQWKNLFQATNYSKFQPAEWIQRWLDTLESDLELEVNDVRQKNFTKEKSKESDSGTDDAMSEYTWTGQWSSRYQTESGHNAIDKLQFPCDEAAVQSHSRTDTRDNSISGIHDDTSGIGSSEHKDESTVATSYAITDEQQYEVNAEEIFSGSNKIIFVTVCCENSMDVGMTCDINKRQVGTYQREVGDWDLNT